MSRLLKIDGAKNFSFSIKNKSRSLKIERASYRTFELMQEGFKTISELVIK